MTKESKKSIGFFLIFYVNACYQAQKGIKKLNKKINKNAKKKRKCFHNFDQVLMDR